jgi:hypothetical protein
LRRLAGAMALTFRAGVPEQRAHRWCHASSPAGPELAGDDHCRKFWRVQQYRLYHVKDGRLISAATFDAESDSDALRQAFYQITFEGVEVWCGGRKVGVLSSSVDPP